MRLHLTHILFFLIPFVSNAQIRIAGTVEQYKNTSISLIEKSDFISKQTLSLETDSIDDNGFFVLSSKQDLIGEYYLKIEDRLISIILEPESEYEIKLTPPENLDNRVSHILLDYESISTRHQIYLANEWQSFSEDINQFLYSNDSLINKSKLQDPIDQFEKEMSAKYANAISTWSYFSDSYRYQFASLQIFSKKSKEAIYKTYIEEREINYKNKQQVLFLRRFYNNNFEKFKLKHHSNFDSIVSSDSAYYRLTASLKEDTLVKSSQLAEFILLNAIKKSARTRFFNYENGNRILSSIVENSSVEEHIEIAKNLLIKRSKLRKGSICPDIIGVDKKGKTFWVQDEVRNRFIYVGFFSSWNRQSVFDLQVISRLKKEFGKDISFVNVSLDRNKEDFKRLLQDYQFNWEIIHFDDDYSIFETFEIKSFPLYFLLAPDGTLVKSPAERPENSIELFRKIKELSANGVKPYEIIQTYSDF